MRSPPRPGRRPAAWAAGGAGSRRSRPAATVSRYQAAAFVPVPAGLTVAAPLTTWSLMPSLGYGVVGGCAEDARDVGLVLAEQQLGHACRRAPARRGGRSRRGRGARRGWRPVGRRRQPSAAAPAGSHDHSLRNQSVGRTWSVGGLGARVADGDPGQDVGRVGLARSRPRRSSSGRRRRCRCRAARTPARAWSAGRSPRSAARTDRPPAGSGSASAATRCWARRRGTTSTP